MLCAFLDEFGHDGLFKSKADPRYNHSPYFGFGGIFIPFEHVRTLAGEFVTLKAYHLKTDRQTARNTEVKGNQIFCNRTFRRGKSNTQRGVRRIGHLLLEHIKDINGEIFYNGIEKYSKNGNDHNPEKLHRTMVRRSVEGFDRFLLEKGDYGLLFFDQHNLHDRRVDFFPKYIDAKEQSETSSHIVEPPYQGSSDLYQTIQAADWVCSMLGKIFLSKYSGREWQENLWAYNAFREEIDAITNKHSRIKLIQGVMEDVIST